MLKTVVCGLNVAALLLLLFALQFLMRIQKHSSISGSCGVSCPSMQCHTNMDAVQERSCDALMCTHDSITDRTAKEATWAKTSCRCPEMTQLRSNVTLLHHQFSHANSEWTETKLAEEDWNEGRT